MTRVGWLADIASVTGGAELTQAEFRAAAPDGVETIDCPAGAVVEGLDLYVCHNCVQYTVDDLAVIGDSPLVRYWHDVGSHLQDGVMEALVARATSVCCSPVQAEYMGLQGAQFIPPPVDLARFERAAASVNGNRAGAVSVGSWRNYGKAPHKVLEWAESHGVTVDVYGGGMFAPPGSQEVTYDGMPELLARYQAFVFLPMVIEPFGRVVAEAWAAGCSLVVNNLIGAKYWIEEKPEAIETAAEDFWRLVLA